jgi:hypothetical protein
VIDLWANSNNWYHSEVKDLKLRLPRGGEPTSASGWAIVGRRKDRVETASTPSWEIWRVNVVQCSKMEEATERCHRYVIDPWANSNKDINFNTNG